jgi:hypothetical protein
MVIVAAQEVIFPITPGNQDVNNTFQMGLMVTIQKPLKKLLLPQRFGVGGKGRMKHSKKNFKACNWHCRGRIKFAWPFKVSAILLEEEESSSM